MIQTFLKHPARLAKALIGAKFYINGIGGIIVETEAYDRNDPASHSFVGPTKRNHVMFEGPALLYVYRSYGVHWCTNFTCREVGHGAAVLLRAIEPTHGIDVMKQRRKTDQIRLLCSGPGRLSQALGITEALNGMSLEDPQIMLEMPTKKVPIITGVRIGISKATEVPWRFGLKKSPFLSRPFKKNLM